MKVVNKSDKSKYNPIVLFIRGLWVWAGRNSRINLLLLSNFKV